MKNAVTIIIVLTVLAGSFNHLQAQEKSTAIALGLSMGVPLITCCMTEAGPLSSNLLVVSLSITPSLGHFYAGHWGRGLLFIGLRSVVVFGTYIALRSSVTDYWHDLEYSMQTSVAIGLVGLAFYGAVTLTDWAFVPSSVQKYNERFQIEPNIDLQHGNYGLGISYRF